MVPLDASQPLGWRELTSAAVAFCLAPNAARLARMGWRLCAPQKSARTVDARVHARSLEFERKVALTSLDRPNKLRLTMVPKLPSCARAAASTPGLEPAGAGGEAPCALAAAAGAGCETSAAAQSFRFGAGSSPASTQLTAGEPSADAFQLEYASTARFELGHGLVGALSVEHLLDSLVRRLGDVDGQRRLWVAPQAVELDQTRRWDLLLMRRQALHGCTDGMRHDSLDRRLVRGEARRTVWHTKPRPVGRIVFSGALQLQVALDEVTVDPAVNGRDAGILPVLRKVDLVDHDVFEPCVCPLAISGPLLPHDASSVCSIYKHRTEPCPTAVQNTHSAAVARSARKRRGRGGARTGRCCQPAAPAA